MSNKQTKRKIQTRRRNGGAKTAALTSVVGFVLNPPAWFDILTKAPDAARSAAALVHDLNRAYEFYSYCETISLDKITNEPLKQRFIMMTTKLGKLIMSIKNGAVISKMLGAIHSAISKNRDAYAKDIDALSKMSINARDDAPKPPETIIHKLSSITTTTFNTSIITVLGDWYRYELNIDLTNLMAIVTELIGLSVLTTTRASPLVSASAHQIPSSIDEAEKAAHEGAIHLGVTPTVSPPKSRRKKTIKSSPQNPNYVATNNPYTIPPMPSSSSSSF
jgi:hypothetical protein